jgi:hypothetical protein
MASALAQAVYRLIKEVKMITVAAYRVFRKNLGFMPDLAPKALIARSWPPAAVS